MERKDIKKSQGGFTLIEIIAVLVILGILAAVAVPRFLDLQSEAANKAAEGALSAAASNVTLTYSQKLLEGGGSLPSRADVIADAETDLGDYTATYGGIAVDGEDCIQITVEGDTIADVVETDRQKNVCGMEFGT